MQSQKANADVQTTGEEQQYQMDVEEKRILTPLSRRRDASVLEETADKEDTQAVVFCLQGSAPFQPQVALNCSVLDRGLPSDDGVVKMETEQQAGSQGAGLGLAPEPSRGEPMIEITLEIQNATLSNEENSSVIGAEEKQKGSLLRESLAHSGQIKSDMAGKDTTLNQTLESGRKRPRTALCEHFKKKRCR
jgi:tRNA 2-selenouridine synthase SelU